jgi:uncharacterized membrane protein YkvA (DUF1232 family)
VARVLGCPAFRHSRDRSSEIIESAADLRALADLVETLDYVDAPLSAVAEHVAAAVRFLRATADHLDRPPSTAPARAEEVDTETQAVHAAASAARQRLVVAALHYLITRDDLVPDFRPGGYIDDVLAMTWVFGAADQELEPYMEDMPAVGDSAEDAAALDS